MCNATANLGRNADLEFNHRAYVPYPQIPLCGESERIVHTAYLTVVGFVLALFFPLFIPLAVTLVPKAWRQRYRQGPTEVED